MGEIMLENFVLLLFIIVLIGSIVLKISLVLALLANLIIFIIYCLIKGHKLKESLNFVYQGFSTCKLMLFIFLLIGMITGTWRACGTISYIIYNAVKIISPNYFYVGIFLFNATVSLLTGSSFGTSSTAGIISMTLSYAINMNPYFSAGAIISGCFVGDRTSPMSTSALLIATITKTDFYNNIKNMIKPSIIPIILTIITFQILNLNSLGTIHNVDLSSIKSDFNFNIILAIPAILIIILAMFKVPLKYNMGLSIIIAISLAYFFQNMSLNQILRSALLGYVNENADKSINGGGVISMAKAILIVGISSGYFGIFKNTDLLKSIKLTVNSLYKKFPQLFVMEILSIIIACFSSNQTLSIMLTYEMSRENIEDKEKLALNLSNSALLNSMFIPWNISGRIPIDTISAPIGGIYFSFYNIYMILVNTLADIWANKKHH